MFGTDIAKRNNTALAKPSSELDFFDDDMFSMMMTMMMIIMMASIMSSLTTSSSSSSSSAAALEYQGIPDARVLTALAPLQWVSLLSGTPFRPWMTASFFNDGLTLLNGDIVQNSVFIGINDPGNLQEVMYGESYNVDLTTSKQGIQVIYYQSTGGASVRVVGKY
jgi:hypothetical protein